jgi:hypothetical protein
MITMKNPLKLPAVAFSAFLLPILCVAYAAEQKLSREEAQFSIYVAGKEIGREKFSIQSSGDSVSSTSILTFRDPGNSGQNVKMETELSMDSKFVPRTYKLRTDVNGQKGIVRGTFAPGQVTFEYESGGNAKKTGLLVGDSYLMLDTNIFHHFIFVARLFDFESKEKSQSIEVIIPQQLENGLLKVSDAGLEKISVRGKSRELHHLKADSGSVQVDLWIDNQRVLYKIALPAKKLEVIRSS